MVIVVVVLLVVVLFVLGPPSRPQTGFGVEVQIWLVQTFLETNNATPWKFGEGGRALKRDSYNAAVDLHVHTKSVRHQLPECFQTALPSIGVVSSVLILTPSEFHHLSSISFLKLLHCVELHFRSVDLQNKKICGLRVSLITQCNNVSGIL